MLTIDLFLTIVSLPWAGHSLHLSDILLVPRCCKSYSSRAVPAGNEPTRSSRCYDHPVSSTREEGAINMFRKIALRLFAATLIAFTAMNAYLAFNRLRLIQ